MLDLLISKNSQTIDTKPNCLMVTCAIVILIAILVLLELHIRRIAHSPFDSSLASSRRGDVDRWSRRNEATERFNPASGPQQPDFKPASCRTVWSAAPILG